MDGDFEILKNKSDNENPKSMAGKLVSSFFKSLIASLVLTIPVYGYIFNNMPQTSPGLGESLAIVIFFGGTFLVLFLIFLTISVNTEKRKYVLGILALVFMIPICIGIYYGPMSENCLEFSKVKRGWCYHQKSFIEKDITLCEKAIDPNKCIDAHHLQNAYHTYKNVNLCANAPRPDNCFYGYAEWFSHRSDGDIASIRHVYKGSSEQQEQIEKAKKTFESACNPIKDTTLKDKCFSFLNDFMKEK